MATTTQETKLVFELNGTGTPVSNMTTTTTGTTTTPTSSDTGVFTNTDGTLKSSTIIGGAICAFAILTIFIARYLKNPHAKHAFITRSFGIHDKNGISKKFGIFGGFFVLMILASAIILPNFLPETESASADSLSLTIGSTDSNGQISSSGTIKSSGTTFVIIGEDLACSVACKISINTNNGSGLNLSNNTSQSYIGPTSGTTSAKSVLGENTWGYTTVASSTATSKVWATVPTNATQVITLSDSSLKTKIYYGANVNSSIPTGSYSNTITYTATEQ